MFTVAYVVLFAIFLLAQFASPIRRRLGVSFHVSSFTIFFVILASLFYGFQSNYILIYVALALFFQVASAELQSTKQKTVPLWLRWFAFIGLGDIFDRSEIVRHGIMSSVSFYMLAIVNTLDHPVLPFPTHGPVVGLMISFAVYHYFASNIRFGLVETSWMPIMYAVAGVMAGFLAQLGLTELALQLGGSDLLALMSFAPTALAIFVLTKKDGLGGKLLAPFFGTSYVNRHGPESSVTALNFSLIYGWMLCIGWYLLQAVVAA